MSNSEWWNVGLTEKQEEALDAIRLLYVSVGLPFNELAWSSLMLPSATPGERKIKIAAMRRELKQLYVSQWPRWLRRVAAWWWDMTQGKP